MKEFKNGDEIWCVMFHQDLHHVNDPEINISIMKGKVIDCEQPILLAENGLSDIISDSNHDNFKSKNEAIEDVISQLEYLKDKVIRIEPKKCPVCSDELIDLPELRSTGCGLEWVRVCNNKGCLLEMALPVGVVNDN